MNSAGNLFAYNLFKWKNFPVLLSSCSSQISEDIFYDFELDLDQQTGLLFQKNIPMQSVVYQEPRNSAVGKVWRDHHDSLYGFVSSFGLKGKSICEIGSGSGFLAQKIAEDFKIDCYEPNACFAANHNINIHPVFFDEKIKQKYDVIIMSHVIEHIVDVNNFLFSLRSNLNDEGRLILSFPDFYSSLEEESISAFNSEHISYFSEDSIIRLLSKNGFADIVIHKYKNHSIFVSAAKVKITKDIFNLKPIDEVELVRIESKISRYLEKIQKKISLIEKRTDKIDNFYLFGCHAMTSILLYLSKIDQNKVINILDNDKLKHNLRLYGTNLFCRSIEDCKPGFVILNAGVYHQEIKSQLLSNNFKII